MSSIQNSPEDSLILAGVSGFSYKAWSTPGFCNGIPLEGFYPKGVGAKRQLSYFSKHIPLLELNSTFYKLPTKKAVLEWANHDVSFIAKFSKYATHSKKMADFGTYFKEFWDDRIEHLGTKCLGILIQLGPAFIHSNRKSKIDGLTMLGRLRAASSFLHDNYPEVTIFIEFRHTSWYCEDIYDFLTSVGWSLVCVHTGFNFGGKKRSFSGWFPRLESIPVTLKDTLMFRCHGTSSLEPYCGNYSEEDLVRMYSHLLGKKLGVCVFDNTDSMVVDIPNMKALAAAIVDASRMKEILSM